MKETLSLNADGSGQKFSLLDFAPKPNVEYEKGSKYKCTGGLFANEYDESTQKEHLTTIHQRLAISMLMTLVGFDHHRAILSASLIDTEGPNGEHFVTFTCQLCPVKRQE